VIVLVIRTVWIESEIQNLELSFLIYSKIIYSFLSDGRTGGQRTGGQRTGGRADIGRVDSGRAMDDRLIGRTADGRSIGRRKPDAVRSGGRPNRTAGPLIKPSDQFGRLTFFLPTCIRVRVVRSGCGW
jgi:hypothetical protein